MEGTLIKISDYHYIVVDDSEIKEGDFCYWKAVKTTFEAVKDSLGRLPKKDDGSFKITHSTQPLNKDFNDWFDVQIITLSEVQELIDGYSIEKMAKKEMSNRYFKDEIPDAINDFKLGFKAHKELVKDKLFTIEDMMDAMGYAAAMDNTRPIQELKEEAEQYIRTKKLLKTEWEVEFDNEGKIKLKP